MNASSYQDSTLILKYYKDESQNTGTEKDKECILNQDGVFIMQTQLVYYLQELFPYAKASLGNTFQHSFVL